MERDAVGRARRERDGRDCAKHARFESSPALSHVSHRVHAETKPVPRAVPCPYARRGGPSPVRVLRVVNTSVSRTQHVRVPDRLSNAPERTRTSDLRFQPPADSSTDRTISSSVPQTLTRRCAGRRALRRTRRSGRGASYAGVSPGRLTRWSLHLPTAVGLGPTPRRRLGSGSPRTR